MAKTRNCTARTGEVERRKRETESWEGEKKHCLFSGGNIFDQFS